MYYEDYSDIHNAIAREKQLKKWLRAWKIELIRKDNPDMIDLAKDLVIERFSNAPCSSYHLFLEKDTGSSPV